MKVSKAALGEAIIFPPLALLTVGATVLLLRNVQE
jgi:hypothetical protein